MQRFITYVWLLMVGGSMLFLMEIACGYFDLRSVDVKVLYLIAGIFFAEISHFILDREDHGSQETEA